MPVVIRASCLSETHLGQCNLRRKRFVVFLNDRMGEPQAVDALCHEWAHALARNYSLERLAKKPGVDREGGSVTAVPVGPKLLGKGLAASVPAQESRAEPHTPFPRKSHKFDMSAT